MFNNMKFFTAFFFISAFIVNALLPDKAEAATQADVKTMIVEEARRNGTVPPSLALAVAKVESGFDEFAESRAGARGVMQIMPKTAKGEFDITADRLWEPRLNIRLGIAYLEQLYHQYGQRWNLALSHYNGGTLKGKGKYARPHFYTRSYVSSVLAWSHRFERETTALALASVTTNTVKSYDNDYWIYDTPDIDKNWRHYLKVADHWMKPENERATSKTANAYWDVEDSSDWMPLDGEDVRPSDRLKAKVNFLRTRFRESLQREEKPWRPIRGSHRPRFS